ncbi:glycoside hydrolase family 88 protein [Draconibacterium sp.]|nr:glycoside hydrolase family 88 protein [Draconibacterium sp.]
MKKFLLIITSIFVITAIECHSQSIENFLRPYADKIVQNASFEFRDKNTNQKYSSTDNLPVKQNLEIESEYLHWRYTSALAYDGLFEFGKTINEESYINFTKNAFAFFFDNTSYYEKVKDKGYTIGGLKNFMRFEGVWNDGALTAALLNIYQEGEIPADYMDYLNQVAKFFFEFDKKEAESTTKKTGKKNVDQIYTKGVFMARMGRLTGETKYFDYCVEQVLEFDSLFYDPMTGLYSQYYYPHLNVTNNIKWLRGSGWAAIGIVNILSAMPEDYPGYDKVLQVFKKLIVGISAYQTKSGLWRHLVNRTDCFEETSGTTYIVYAVAKGVNDGYLAPEYSDVAIAGWQGILSMQDADGKIRNVTSHVSGSTSPAYYYNNPVNESDDHLYGALFLAGVEMMKLSDY